MSSMLRLAAAVVIASAGPALAQQNMAHIHMGHVSDAWNDTPNGRGLLPTAVAEAEIAAQHAGFAASRPTDLDWMKMHVGHVAHAIDPSVEPSGPGLGYGVKAAAAGVAAHIGFAAEAGAASDNVKLHAPHVATSARNAVAWSDEVLVLADGVAGADEPGPAAEMVERIAFLAGAILDGTDADGDGTITWQDGEGGLAQASQHMGFMRAGEGM